MYVCMHMYVDMWAIGMNIKEDWKLNKTDSRNSISKNNLLVFWDLGYLMLLSDKIRIIDHFLLA